jgi:hypothetical protein
MPDPRDKRPFSPIIAGDERAMEATLLLTGSSAISRQSNFHENDSD